MTERSHIQKIKRWDWGDEDNFRGQSWVSYIYLRFEWLIDFSIFMGKGPQYPKSQCIKANKVNKKNYANIDNRLTFLQFIEYIVLIIRYLLIG